MADTADDLKELVVRYPQMRDAVRMAMVDALKSAGDGKEWGGAIFQRGDQFYASKPQSSKKGSALQIRAVADMPGDHPAAVYHTHPNTPTSDRFSRDDVEFAKAFGKPSFLSAGRDTMIFDPKTDLADRTAPSERQDYSKGGATGRVYLKKDLLAQALRLATN